MKMFYFTNLIRHNFSDLSRSMASAKTSKELLSKISSELIKQWDEIQIELRNQIVYKDTEPWQTSPDFRVAGIDISIDAKDNKAHECDAFAAVVICDFPSMEVIHQETKRVHLTVPYVPGYLAFRESEPGVDLIFKILRDHPDKKPDVILIDGNGVLHPQRCGLASHIGIRTSIPSIGVAKNLHLIEGIKVNKQTLQGLPSVGDSVLIQDESDENRVLGMALKTASDTKNPMYISVGHKISLETAKHVVLKCSKYRVPDPIRFADNISRELIRKYNVEKSQTNKE